MSKSVSRNSSGLDMREKLAFVMTRIAIRTARIVGGGIIGCLVVFFGFGYSVEFLSSHSLIGFVDGVVVGIISLMGLVGAFFIAFGETEKRKLSKALELPTASTNKIHRVRNQQSARMASDGGRGRPWHR
jgi:hypothetical protein